MQHYFSKKGIIFFLNLEKLVELVTDTGREFQLEGLDRVL